MNIYYVYIWYNPTTHKPFYVGKGKNSRAYAISKKSRNDLFLKEYDCFIRQGKKPYVVIIEMGLSEEESLVLERKLIKKYGMLHQGGILTNKSLFEGGKSNISPTTKKLLSDKVKGELNGSSRFSTEEITKCFDLLVEGLSNKNIEEITGIPSSTISDLRYGKKWNHIYVKYKPFLHGKVGNSKYKFTHMEQLAIIKSIIDCLKNGNSLKDLTKKWDITYEYLMSIRTKRIWKSAWKTVENIS